MKYELSKDVLKHRRNVVSADSPIFAMCKYETNHENSLGVN
jgi:hypothetical protein